MYIRICFAVKNQCYVYCIHYIVIASQTETYNYQLLAVITRPLDGGVEFSQRLSASVALTRWQQLLCHCSCYCSWLLARWRRHEFYYSARIDK